MLISRSLFEGVINRDFIFIRFFKAQPTPGARNPARGHQSNLTGQPATKLLTSDLFQSDRGWCQLLVFFFPRGCKNNIPVLLTLDHPQSDRAACHQASYLWVVSRQQGLVPITCFFPVGILKQHSCFDNVRSPTIWEVSLSPSLLPLKCFKATRAGTNYLFFSSRGDAKTTFLFC